MPVAPSAEDIHDSAPLRDFVRLQRPQHEPGSRLLTLPAVGGDNGLGVTLALLALHARRDLLALVVRRGAALRSIVVRVDPCAPVPALAQSLYRGLDDPAAAPWPDGDRVKGVLVDLADSPATRPAAAPPADLSLRLQPGADGIELTFTWDRLLYLDDSIDPLARQIASAAAAVARGTVASVAELPFIDDAERQRLLVGFNGDRVDFGAEHTMHGLIEAQVRRKPGHVCATHRGTELTFAALDAASNRMARQLAALGVAPGRFVAIVDARGLDFVIAMLAVWKTGAAYVPVDPGYPADRIRHMLADSETAVAVVGADALRRLNATLGGCPALRHLVCPQPLPEAIDPPPGVQLLGPADLAAMPPHPPPDRATPRDAAYMIYTSGSTGRPKGAVVRHDGAVNHLLAQARALGADAVSRFLQSAPSSSDISVWQFAAPLALGGVTAIVDDPTDVALVLHTIRQQRLGLVELVPALLRWLVAHAQSLPETERSLPDLHWMMITGESAPVDLVNAWLSVYPQIPVVNAYGPTEAADDVAQAVIRKPLPARRSRVPIGQPLANMDLYVLDGALRLLPPGVPGELCVAGIGVGSGYWRQPERTAQSFVANPFAQAAGSVIYRTGDLGRWRDDGSLEYLGRLDNQVQLRGFRIELQEIEAVLAAETAVAEAVVRAFHDGEGDGQLVAWIVPRPGHPADDDQLRAALATRLPSHMVPSTILRIAAMPLNPAGKIDRGALVPPPRHRVAVKAALTSTAPPVDGAEGLLAELWQQELDLATVGRDDDFFALGGDSLAALAIAVGATRKGLPLRSADVLAHPTIARLAAHAHRSPRLDLPGRSRSAGTEIEPNAVVAAVTAVEPLNDAARADYLARHLHAQDVRALDPPQLGILLHGLLAQDKTAYIDQYVYQVDGELDPQAFEQAWKLVVRRHPALRTAFIRRPFGRPAQVIWREVPVGLARLDHSSLPPELLQSEIDAVCAADRASGFDLARPPLMRLTLVRLAVDRHRLVWTHHHLALDGWSLGLVLDEVRSAHDAMRSGLAASLPSAVDPAGYSRWLANHDIAAAESFWRRELQGCGDAPDWRLSPPRAGVGLAEVEVDCDEIDGAALSRRAAAWGVTLTTVLQAAWALEVAALSGREDVVLGVVTSGRELPVPGIESMVGLFVTSLPLRVNIGSARADSLGAWLGEIQCRSAAIRAHEAVPLARIARWCGLTAGKALFETLFVMSNYPAHAVSAGGLRIEPAGFRTVPAYALSLIATATPRLTLRLCHDRRRLDADQARALGASLVRRLAQLASGLDPRSHA